MAEKWILINKEIIGTKLSQPNSEIGFRKGPCPLSHNAYFPLWRSMDGPHHGVISPKEFNN